MSEYYGVQRSEEYLAHYGIKGMKWGVQKAKAMGDSYALNKQYIKASKKLEKLNKKADLKRNQQLASKYKNRAVRGAAGTALAGGLTGLNHHNIKVGTTVDGVQINPAFANDLLYAAGYNKEGNLLKAMRIGRQVAGAATAGLAGTTAYNAAKAAYHSHKASAKGHAKAVAKRDAWKKEMQSAFKGTKYGASKNKKR